MIDLDFCIFEIFGQKISFVQNVSGGYTQAQRKIVTLESGKKIFVKGASDELTAQWLRDEQNVYQHLSADFLPLYLGWFDDRENPALFLEDLSEALWPKSWNEEQISAVLNLLQKLEATFIPESLILPVLEDKRFEFASWKLIEEDPEDFLRLGLCSKNWLDKSLPFLIQNDAEIRLEGDSLLHFDIRSDNICFDFDRTILVDWNWACRGNSRFDLIAWLPSLHAEGGPAPGEMILSPTKEDLGLALMLAGFWAYRAGMPPPHSGSTLRSLQLVQLKCILPWAVSGLDLEQDFFI